ncbi:MAG: polynucleotide adenylyltransferase PcnB [Deltaproteobacteria bacterium]|nr:polynucleotide adenylyltransferase PcnB [Deltaproteobacteria bacterium]
MDKSDVAPRIISRHEHCVSRKNMTEDVIKVLYRLKNTGNIAYLCGGGVRDLLQGIGPKDFDVVTDARPSAIKNIFRNSRLVGRRFRIVHVFFKGGRIVEVSTFRKKAEYCQHDAEEPIKSDNTFGTPAEDAFRRDFTVNALYYDIRNFAIIDYVCGMEDLRQKIIRAIGDPDVRFQEDPIRILRGIRLAALMDFTIEENALQAMTRQRELIFKCAAPRILEEIFRTLRRPNSDRAFKLLAETQTLDIILPDLVDFVGKAEHGFDGPLPRLLRAMDNRRQVNERTYGDHILLAALFYLPVTRFLKSLPSGCDPETTVNEYLSPIGAALNIPKLALQQARHLIMAQDFFETGAGMNPKRRFRLFKRPYMADAVEFFRIQSEAGGLSQEEVEVILAQYDQPGAKDKTAACQPPHEIPRGPNQGIKNSPTGEASGNGKNRKRRRRHRPPKPVMKSGATKPEAVNHP